jgi:TP901 family phage tail tape measure protein
MADKRQVLDVVIDIISKADVSKSVADVSKLANSLKEVVESSSKLKNVALPDFKNIGSAGFVADLKKVAAELAVVEVSGKQLHDTITTLQKQNLGGLAGSAAELGKAFGGMLESLRKGELTKETTPLRNILDLLNKDNIELQNILGQVTKTGAAGVKQFIGALKSQFSTPETEGLLTPFFTALSKGLQSKAKGLDVGGLKSELSGSLAKVINASIRSIGPIAEKDFAVLGASITAYAKAALNPKVEVEGDLAGKINTALKRVEGLTGTVSQILKPFKVELQKAVTDALTLGTSSGDDLKAQLRKFLSDAFKGTGVSVNASGLSSFVNSLFKQAEATVVAQGSQLKTTLEKTVESLNKIKPQASTTSDGGIFDSKTFDGAVAGIQKLQNAVGQLGDGRINEILTAFRNNLASLGKSAATSADSTNFINSLKSSIEELRAYKGTAGFTVTQIESLDSALKLLQATANKATDLKIVKELSSSNVTIEKTLTNFEKLKTELNTAFGKESFKTGKIDIESYRAALDLLNGSYNQHKANIAGVISDYEKQRAALQQLRTESVARGAQPEVLGDIDRRGQQLDAVISKYRELSSVLENNRTQWAANAREVLASQNAVDSAIKGFRETANTSSGASQSFFNALTKIAGITTILSSDLGQGTAAARAFSDEFNKFALSGQQVTTSFQQAQVAFKNLFTQQGDLGKRFDLDQIKKGVEDLKRLGAESGSDTVFKKYHQDLAILNEFLIKAGLGSSKVAAGVKELFDTSTAINKFATDFKSLNEQLTAQDSKVSRLANTYQTINTGLKELASIQAQITANQSKGVDNTSLLKQETELRAKLTRQVADYSREVLSAGVAQDYLATRITTLQRSAGELGITQNFDAARTSATALASTLETTKKSFDGLKLEAQGFSTQFAGGAKTAETALKNFSQVVTKELIALNTKIKTSFNIEGLDSRFVGDIERTLRGVVAAIRSGKGIDGAFKELRSSFQRGLDSLSGNATAQNALVKAFNDIVGSLGGAATRLTNQFEGIKQTFGPAFATGGQQVEQATSRVNALNSALAASKTAASDFSKSANASQVAADFDKLSVKTRELREQLGTLTRLPGVLNRDDARTAEELVRKLKDLTSEWGRLRTQTQDGLINEAHFRNVRTSLDSVKAGLQGLFDRSKLQESIGAIQEQFRNIIPRGVIKPDALIQEFRTTGINAAEVFKQALLGGIEKVPTRQLNKVTDQIKKALSNAVTNSGTETQKVLNGLLTQWTQYKDHVVAANQVIAAASNQSLKFLREGAAGGQVGLGQSFTDLQTKVTAANTEVQSLRTTLGDLLRGDTTVVTGALVQGFNAVTTTATHLKAAVGEAKSELHALTGLIKTIELKPATDPLAAFLPQLKAAQAQLVALVQSKEQLDAAVSPRFAKELEHIINVAERGNSQVKLLNTISGEFSTAGYFNKPAQELNTVYLNLQRIESALSKARNDLQNQLGVARLGSTDPALAAELKGQIAAFDAAIDRTQKYNQVLGQLRSTAKTEIFGRLTQELTKITTAMAESGKSISLVKVEEIFGSGLQKLAADFSSVSALILSGGTALTQGLVDKFKTVSVQTKQTTQDLAAWRQILESKQAAGFQTVNIDGVSVRIKGLLAEVTKLEAGFNALTPTVNNASGTLQTRLGSVLGQLQLKVDDAVQKFNTLKLSIDGISQAGVSTGTFTTLRQMMDELGKSFGPGNKFFTMTKGQFAPLRDELSSYVQGLRAALNTLTLYTSTVQASGDQQILTSKAYKDTQQILVQLQAEYNRASAAQLKFNELGKKANEFAPIRDQFGNVAISMAELLEKGAGLSHGLQKFFGFIAKSSNQLGVIPQRAQQAISAFNALEKQMVRFRSGIIQWTMGVQMAGQALLDPFKKATSGFIDFSDRLGIIASVSNAVTTEFHRLKSAAILMGATTRFTTEQAAEGLEKLARAGFNVENQLAMLPSVMRLAQAAATDLATAAEISTIVMNEFRMDPEQFKEATDVLALAANRTQATISDLGFGFKYIGALAANVGADFSDLTASLALLHNAGMKGTMAGTALRGMMQRLMNPTRENADLLAQLSERIGGVGLVLQNAKGDFVGFRSILEQLERAGITTGEVLKIFGQRAGPGMAALLAMGSDRLKELEEDLENSAGTAAKMSDTMEKTFKGQLLLMRSAFSALSDSVGMNLSSTLIPLAAAVADITNKFIALRNEFPSLTKVFDSGLAGIAIFAATLGAVAVTWSMIIVPTIQFIAMLKTLTTTFFVAAGAMTASSVATAKNTAATVINTGAKAVNVAGTTAQVGANSALVVSTNAVTGAIVAQTVAMNASAAASARMLLGAIFSGKGLMAIGRFLVTNPWGIAITALGTIAALTLSQKKSVEIVNVELQKQREVLEFNRREMELLGSKAAATADRIKSLTDRLAGIGSDTRLSAELNLELKANEQQYQAQLQEIFKRLTDENSPFREIFIPVIELDPATGQFKTFTLQVSNSEQAFNLLSGSMEDNAASLRKLTIEMNDFKRASDEALSLDKLRNVAQQSTGQYSFWQQINPFNRNDLQSLDKDISAAERRFEQISAIRDEFAKPVSERNKDFFKTMLRDFEQIAGRGGSFDRQWLDAEGIPRQVEEYFSKLGNRLNDLKPKHQTMIQNFAQALAEHFDILGEEQKRKFQEMESAEQVDFLKSLIQQALPDAKTNAELRKNLDAVVANTVQAIKDAQEKLQKEIAQIQPIDVSRSQGLLFSLGDLLAASEKELKERLGKQKEIVESGQALIDEVKKYQSIIIEQLAQDFTVKMGKITFDERVAIDAINANFTLLEAGLQAQAKVIELPLDTAIKNFSRSANMSSLAGAYSRFNTGILSFERQFSQDLFTARRDRDANEVTALRNAVQEQQNVIREHLKAVEKLYDGSDNLGLVREQQSQTQALRQLKETEYQIAKDSYDRQVRLLLDLRQKEQQLVSEALAFRDRLAKASASFQTRSEDGEVANLQKRAEQLEKLGRTAEAERTRARADRVQRNNELARESRLRAQLVQLEQELRKEMRVARTTGDFERTQALRDQLMSFIENAMSSSEPGGYLDTIMKRATDQMARDADTVAAGLKAQAEQQIEQVEQDIAIDQRAMDTAKQGLEAIEAELININNQISTLRQTEELSLDFSTEEARKELTKFSKLWMKTIQEMEKQELRLTIGDIKDQPKTIEDLKAQIAENEQYTAQLKEMSERYEELLKQQKEFSGVTTPVLNLKKSNEELQSFLSEVKGLNGGRVAAEQLGPFTALIDKVASSYASTSIAIKNSDLPLNIKEMMQASIAQATLFLNETKKLAEAKQPLENMADRLSGAMDGVNRSLDAGTQAMQERLKDFPLFGTFISVLARDLAAVSSELGVVLGEEGFNPQQALQGAVQNAERIREVIDGMSKTELQVFNVDSIEDFDNKLKGVIQSLAEGTPFNDMQLRFLDALNTLRQKVVAEEIEVPVDVEIDHDEASAYFDNLSTSQIFASVNVDQETLRRNMEAANKYVESKVKLNIPVDADLISIVQRLQNLRNVNLIDPQMSGELDGIIQRLGDLKQNVVVPIEVKETADASIDKTESRLEELKRPVEVPVKVANVEQTAGQAVQKFQTAFINGLEITIPVELKLTEEVDMSDVVAQGEEWNRIFRERAEAQGINIRVDTTEVKDELSGVFREIKVLTATDQVITVDAKTELLKQKMLEVDLQFNALDQKQILATSQLTAAIVQQGNERQRVAAEVAAMTDQQAQQELTRLREVAAERQRQRAEINQASQENEALMKKLKEASDIDPIRVDEKAQQQVGEIQSKLQQLKDSGATNIEVKFDDKSGKLIVTADVSQANEQVAGILEQINASSAVLKVDATAAKSQAAELNAMIDNATRNRTIRITYVTSGQPPFSTIQANQNGGIIHRALGGLIPIQKFAVGGLAKFKKLLSPIVPGSGSGDTVPAMLEPGEFVIRKKAVQSLGTDFLNLLNSGLIQFKNFGGMVESLPLNTLRNLSSMVGSTSTIPQMSNDGGGTVNINLKMGDKSFKVNKIPRDQVSQLVGALNYLSRAT